jgi:hypothetical protein
VSADPKPPTLQGQLPIRVDLGTYRCDRGEYRVQLVIRRPALADLIRRALSSKVGRSILAGGGIAVLVSPIRTAPPATAREGRAS